MKISDKDLALLIHDLQAYKDDGVVDPWVLADGRTIEPLDVLRELSWRRHNAQVLQQAKDTIEEFKPDETN